MQRCNDNEAADALCLTALAADLSCPVCMSLVADPFVTPCGHTFCFACVSKALEASRSCPSCSAALATDAIYPNFSLSKVAKRLRSVGACAGSGGRLEALRAALAEGARDLSGPELDHLLHQLWDAKQAAEERERRGSMELLLHFLQASREDKGRRLGELQRELRCLEADIARVEGEAAAPPPLWRPPPCGCLDHEPAAQAGAEKPELHVDRVASAGMQQAMQAAAAASQALQQQQQRKQQQRQQQPDVSLQRHLPGLPPYLSGQLVLQQAQQAAGLPHNTAAALRPAGESGRHATAGLPHSKRRRICSQFEDLQACYLRLRAEHELRQRQACAGRDEGMGSQASGGGEAVVCCGGDGSSGEPPVGPLVDDGLQEFSRVLSVLTRCNKLQVVAEIPRPSMRASPAIVSSLDFDPEGGLFATAGVSRRISIYDYAAVTSAAPVHVPLLELATRSKLSCLSWNRYVRSQLACSDYDGVVTLWDVGTRSVVQEYEAHARRIWSVDCCEADPTLLASGSDDCSVKLWSTQACSAAAATSLATLELKANVCAVKWRPGSAREVAVGCADHLVYLYDLRSPAQPLCTLPGHAKAVSYVRFCSPSDLISASTDSTLRLWSLSDLDGAHGSTATVATVAGGGAGSGATGSGAGAGVLEVTAERIFEGHTNEKNFVGLDVEGDLVACGSESNELFVYFKALSKPIAWCDFAAGPPGSSGAAAEDGTAGSSHGCLDHSFISAVTWRPRSSTLVAANSLGTVKVLQLTGSATEVDSDRAAQPTWGMSKPNLAV